MISDPLGTFDSYYRWRVFEVGSFFRNICASQMSLFENFDFDTDFQVHLLEMLDGHIQCDRFGEILWISGWTFSEMFDVCFFLFYPGETFSTFYSETTLCGYICFPLKVERVENEATILFKKEKDLYLNRPETRWSIWNLRIAKAVSEIRLPDRSKSRKQTNLNWVSRGKSDWQEFASRTGYNKDRFTSQFLANWYLTVTQSYACSPR